MAWGKKSRHERGYGSQWVRLRDRVMKRDQYLCRSCRKKGLVEIATEVDHITPKANGGTDDLSNLQALCSSCHKEKTARDNGAEPRPAIGVDGWPIDES